MSAVQLPDILDVNMFLQLSASNPDGVYPIGHLFLRKWHVTNY